MLHNGKRCYSFLTCIRKGDCILISLCSLSHSVTSTNSLRVIGGAKVDENLNKPERIDVTRTLEIQDNQDGASANNLNKGTSTYGEGLERLPDKTNYISSLNDVMCRPQNSNVDDLVPSYPVEKKKDVPNTSQVFFSYAKKKNARQADNRDAVMIPCMVNEPNASESGIIVKVSRRSIFRYFSSLDFIFIFRYLKICSLSKFHIYQ